MSENIEELFDEEIIGEEIADENKELNNEEQTEEQVEEITHEERVIKTENEELPQYEETYENDIFVYDESEAIEEKTEKKSFLNNVTNKSEHYVDYKTRLLANSLTFIALFIITIIFLQGAFSKTTNQMINYNEMSNLDYKVYLKENNFYESDYLGKNKVYIANLIDNIEINFRYNYNIEKPSNVDFNYSIVAKLTIDDGSSKNNYFEKEYVLLNNQRKSIKSGTNYNLNEKVKIDYAYYNNLANSFKQQFGLDTTSYLTVYLRVNKNTNIENASNAVENSTMFVKIPLSEKAINIELNYQDINNSNYVIQNIDTKTDNIIFGILSIISLIAMLVFGIKTLRLLILLRGKKSIYDKYVEKILNEYDRLIVENGTGPDTSNTNVIKISKFEELLDVRDNLKLPIMYYVVTKHTKCCFYIKHNDDLYLLTIKSVDLEQKQD
ncbi:MAG: hypothetical protein IJA30_06965 [Bacilli bacterium]|nr:hypothetical protein [Bacilli bacterium]